MSPWSVRSCGLHGARSRTGDAEFAKRIDRSAVTHGGFAAGSTNSAAALAHLTPGGLRCVAAESATVSDRPSDTRRSEQDIPQPSQLRTQPQRLRIDPGPNDRGARTIAAGVAGAAGLGRAGLWLPLPMPGMPLTEKAPKLRPSGRGWPASPCHRRLSGGKRCGTNKARLRAASAADRTRGRRRRSCCGNAGMCGSSTNSRPNSARAGVCATVSATWPKPPIWAPAASRCGATRAKRASTASRVLTPSTPASTRRTTYDGGEAHRRWTQGVCLDGPAEPQLDGTSRFPNHPDPQVGEDVETASR